MKSTLNIFCLCLCTLGHIKPCCFLIHSLFKYFLVIKYILIISSVVMIGLVLAWRMVLLKLSHILLSSKSHLVYIIKNVLHHYSRLVLLISQSYAFSSKAWVAILSKKWFLWVELADAHNLSFNVAPENSSLTFWWRCHIKKWCSTSGSNSSTAWINLAKYKIYTIEV